MNANIPWNLITAKLRKTISPEDALLFDRWITTEDNQQLFRHIETVWKETQQRSAVYEPDVEYYWNKLASHLQLGEYCISKPRKSLTLTLYQKAASIAAILTVIAVSCYFLINYALNDSHILTHKTGSAKQTILLPDSSEVILHKNTVLTYSTSRVSKQRKVSIRGEAYFKVRHDSKIPFLVDADGFVIEVHGTEFNVSAYPLEEKALVSLVKGSISMRTPEKSIYLQPGEEGLLNRDNNTILVAKGDVELAKVWAEDKIRFENKSLSEVCKYLSKWYDIDIKIEQDIIENQSYTFTVSGQPLVEIINIMSKINSFEYQFIANNKLILKQKNK